MAVVEAPMVRIGRLHSTQSTFKISRLVMKVIFCINGESIRHRLDMIESPQVSKMSATVIIHEFLTKEKMYFCEI